MKITPPAVRFIRCFDVIESRIVNVWFKLETQEQIDDVPGGLELVVTAQTYDEALAQIAKLYPLHPDILAKIKAAIPDARPLKPALYEARGA